MYQQWIENILAVNIGGTKVIVARVTRENQIVNWHLETTVTAGPLLVMEQLVRRLRDLLDETSALSILAIGIGIPVILERGNDLVIWRPNRPGFCRVKLREPLE
jgi:predicted NBD/HSP70 family sugar kinase